VGLEVALAVALVSFLLVLYVGWQRRRRLIRRLRGALDAQLAAYRSGDYEGQLRAIEGLKGTSFMRPGYLFLRGSALHQLGQLDEAAESIRESLAMETDPHKKALCEDELGLVLLEQKRYADAIACFERAISDWPHRGRAHRAMAIALLRQGEESAVALSWARTAVQIDEAAEAVTPEGHDLNLAEALATLAWVISVDSADAAEVDRLLARAFTLCPETSRPVRANLHYHAGLACAALGKAEESAGHFERAVSVDPNGNFGRLAKAAQREAQTSAS
jgi:tetratricopeptide (TPR) repeat protein